MENTGYWSDESDRAAEVVKRRYNLMAPIFGFIERCGGGARLRQWRALLWTKVEGQNILEVGVGTGANFKYYPPGIRVTAIDFSRGMLERAREKAKNQSGITIEEMDVQNLSFADNQFDTVVASLVFCAVSNPARGLSEIKRVCKPNGKVVLLEHVASSSRLLSLITNIVNPIVFWMMGDNLNRRTVEAVSSSGLKIETVNNLSGIFRLIEARKTG